MLKRFVTFLLITCTLSANFSMLFIYAGFEVNKTYIASTLCENRDKPWLHCNGHCYLMKKIKQAEEKERNEEHQASKNLFQEAIVEKAAPFIFHQQLLAVIDIPYLRFNLPQHHANIFQPPKSA